MRRLTVTRQAGRYHVSAEAEVKAGRQTTWDVLSDYDALASIVPGLVASRRLSRHGHLSIIEQQGQVGTGLFRQTFRMTLEVTEHAHQRIDARITAGDFEHFDATYTLEDGSADRTRVLYTAQIRPRFALPLFLDLTLMEMAARGQFNALLNEIERRAAEPTPIRRKQSDQEARPSAGRKATRAAAPTRAKKAAGAAGSPKAGRTSTEKSATPADSVISTKSRKSTASAASKKASKATRSGKSADGLKDAKATTRTAAISSPKRPAAKSAAKSVAKSVPDPGVKAGRSTSRPRSPRKRTPQ